tara:strand:+ start:2376 stop:2546 length:171 start_codon:yes stop_codon:yes gene_type:complete
MQRNLGLKPMSPVKNVTVGQVLVRFSSALNTVFSSTRIEAATGFEVDQHYGETALM